MSNHSRATVLYGLNFPKGSKEFEHIEGMEDWTPIDELENSGPVRVVPHGYSNTRLAYIVGIPVAEALSLVDPVKLPDPGDWEMNAASILAALHKIGLRDTPQATFGWYLVAYLG